MDSFDIIDHYISRLDFMLKDENQRKPDYNEFKVQLYHQGLRFRSIQKPKRWIRNRVSVKIINNMDKIGINTL